MRKTQNTASVDLAAALILFCVYAGCVLLCLMMGANVYRRTVDEIDARFGERTTLAYLTARVRAYNGSGMIRITQFGDGAALEMTETLDGIDLVTTIYCHDGSLCELYTEAGLRFSPEDGEAVAPAEGLSFQMAGDGLLEISVTGNGGRAAALVATVGAQDERT